MKEKIIFGILIVFLIVLSYPGINVSAVTVDDAQGDYNCIASWVDPESSNPTNDCDFHKENAGYADIKSITWEEVVVETVDKYRVTVTYWDDIISVSDGEWMIGNVHFLVNGSTGGTAFAIGEVYKQIWLKLNTEGGQWRGDALGVHETNSEPRCLTTTSDSFIWTFNQSILEGLEGEVLALDEWEVQAWIQYYYNDLESNNSYGYTITDEYNYAYYINMQNLACGALVDFPGFQVIVIALGALAVITLLIRRIGKK